MRSCLTGMNGHLSKPVSVERLKDMIYKFMK